MKNGDGDGGGSSGGGGCGINCRLFHVPNHREKIKTNG